jgi:hypothetical protein
MRSLLRKPLTWMVLAEIVVVAALGAVSWHLITGVAGSQGAPVVIPEVAPVPDGSAVPDLPPGVLSPPEASAAPMLPGLNVDPAFWRARLAALNEAEAQIEALEWRIVHSALETIQRYLDSVVIPAVERAERRA